MIQSKFDERRQAERAKRILNIRYRLASKHPTGKDKRWHISTTEDMSVYGLAFTTDKAYKAGEILEINVVMAGVLDIFNGFGTVVRSEKKKAGDYFKIAVKYSNLKSRRSASSYTAKIRKSKKIKQLHR